MWLGTIHTIGHETAGEKYAVEDERDRESSFGKSVFNQASYCWEDDETLEKRQSRAVAPRDLRRRLRCAPDRDPVADRQARLCLELGSDVNSSIAS